VGNARATHPTCQDRFARTMCVGLQTLGNLCGIGHSLWSKGDEQTVAVWILRHHVERSCITIRVSISEDIDRVAVAPVSGQKFIEFLQSRFGKLGKLATVCYQ